jgi:hypothetical protein
MRRDRLPRRPGIASALPQARTTTGLRCYAPVSYGGAAGAALGSSCARASSSRLDAERSKRDRIPFVVIDPFIRVVAAHLDGDGVRQIHMLGPSGSFGLVSAP